MGLHVDLSRRATSSFPPNVVTAEKQQMLPLPDSCWHSRGAAAVSDPQTAPPPPFLPIGAITIGE